MSNEAFKRGFMKASAVARLTPDVAESFYKVAFPSVPANSPLFDGMVSGGIPGAIGGGLIGGGLGYMSGKDEDPEKDHSLRYALGGGLMGAGLGAAAGGYYGANDAFDTTRDQAVSKSQEMQDLASKQFKDSTSSWQHGLTSWVPGLSQEQAGADNTVRQQLKASQASIDALKNTSMWKALISGTPLQ